jgi:trimeric autotransporter adhesin
MRFLRTFAGQKVRTRLKTFRGALAIVCVAWCGGPLPVWASPATTTTLSITSGGNPVASIAGGTVLTLTATVQAGTAVLKVGQVNFCDAAADSCTDIHLLGAAPLTSAGSASLRFRPGPGSHRYKAVFLGTPAGEASASADVGLTVGPPPGLQTTFAVASISGPVATSTFDTYVLTARVGTKGAIPPSGTVSYSGSTVATGNTFSLPGTATLGPVSGGTGFLNVPIPIPNNDSADAPPIVVIGDFNNDGIPDIVSAPRGGIAISLGNGDGTFAAPLIPNVDSLDGINAFGIGDFNGDGIPDLLVADEDTGGLTVLLGKGDGTFTARQSMHYATTSIAVADFNGDGKLDVALAGSTQTTILLGNGDGTFTASPNAPSIGSVQLVAADFNGDGKLDLGIASYNDTTFTPGAITILLGNGDGTFIAAPSQPQFVASQLVAADFNCDGKLDLAAISSTANSVVTLLGNGDGTFTAPATLATDANFASQALAVGDFNGDGKLDVAIAASPNTPSEAFKVSILAGNGDGTFANRFDVGLVAGSLTSLAAADLTGNGSSDLAAFGSVFLGSLTITTATADNVLPVGFDIIQAEYPGDANNAASNSTNAPAISVPQQIFSLSSTPLAVTPGGSANGSFSVTSTGFTGTLNLSCAISATQNQANPPNCSVPATVNFFSAGSTVNQSYTITAQAATPAGQYSITITGMDPVGGTSASTTAGVQLVAAQNYQLSNSGATIASAGASGSSTITVSPLGGFTGQVTLSCAVTGGPNGAVNPPTCSIPSAVNVTGSAVTTTLKLNTQAATTPGSYTVNVTGVSTRSTSATTILTISVPAPPASFTLSSTAVTIATPGSKGTSTITISPSGGFTGNVFLSCAVMGGPMGAADAPTCAVAAPLPITGATPVTTALTVSTTAASVVAYGNAAASSQNPPRASAIGGSLAAMASLLLFGLPVRRRRTMLPVGLFLLATLIGTASGCGKYAAAPPANPATTPGAYTVTVTGSSGAITATTDATVTVN